MLAGALPSTERELTWDFFKRKASCVQLPSAYGVRQTSAPYRLHSCLDSCLDAWSKHLTRCGARHGSKSTEG